MTKKKVAVVYGGFTAEKNISLGSGKVVAANIDSEKYDVFPVLIEENGWFIEPGRKAIDKNDFSFSGNGTPVKFDIVFNAIHGSPGEDGKLQGYLDMMHIPYTSCGASVAALTFNKSQTKIVLEDAVPQAKGILLRRGDDIHTVTAQIIKDFHLPYFVKPNNNGSSYGVSKIKDASLLEEAVHAAFQFDDEVLVEEGITGTEYTCGVYRYLEEIVVLPLCLVSTPKHEFFDYTAKYTSGESDEVIPAPVTEELKNKIASLSEAVYRKLNCRGVVRIDYIVRDNTPYFLEVNTVPGMSEASIVPKMALASGLSLKEFFTRLLEEASCDAP